MWGFSEDKSDRPWPMDLTSSFGTLLQAKYSDRSTTELVRNKGET
jgi:hypothetical protein